MKMISEEEFLALNYDEQRKYLIYVISGFTDEKRNELYKRMKENGIIED